VEAGGPSRQPHRLLQFCFPSSRQSAATALSLDGRPQGRRPRGGAAAAHGHGPPAAQAHGAAFSGLGGLGTAGEFAGDAA